LVKREVDEENRRQKKVSLTPKGEETLSRAIDQLKQWEDYLFNDNPIERKELQKTLKEVAIKSIELNQKEE
jgi:DNA-binding MarR family transcriptional regulator